MAGAKAETFRVNKNFIAVLEDFNSSVSFECGSDDSVYIKLPENKILFDGIEISVKVPKVVAEWRDSVAWSLYQGISGAIDEDRIDFEGRKAVIGTFANSLSLNIRVPVSDNHLMERDSYTYLVESPCPINDNQDLFFRLQLAMKGVSDEVPLSRFQITIRPVTKNEGLFYLKASVEDGEEIKNYTVFIDGKETDCSSVVVLPTGSHNFSLVSDFYRNEVRTIVIEKAKKTELEVVFKDIKPVVCIAAPEKTRVIFDDMELVTPVEPFYTTSGEHTVRFFVGDYETVKKINVENGRNYNVSINMDVDVSEVE